MKLYKEVGKKIKNTRIDRGLSREDLAELSGLSFNLIGMIERGEVNTGIGNIYKLSKVLKIKLVEVVEGF